MNTVPLLIEIGVEEIPAGVAPRMGEALQQALTELLSKHHIESSDLALGVTPRRLLIHADACPLMQADRKQILWGPPEKVAFREGDPTKAAEGFAKKSGLRVEDFELADKGDGKARYMKAVQTVHGRDVCSIIAEAMPDILRKLPSPKSMRWQDGATRADAFIRPIRWIVARLGDEIIPFTFAGIASGLQSRGHRMCKDNLGEISVDTPFAWLEERMVIADRDTRKAKILNDLLTSAKDAGVSLVKDDDLIEEVTDLTEWPHVITGHYDEDFLRLPIEVSRIELKHHQRCFSTVDDKGNTSHVFFAVANIKSKNPAAVAQGNERVVNARLADATFFYDRDPKTSLEARVEILSTIVFQDGLGMVGDQVGRLRGFVLDNAKALGIDANEGQRAAYLCKSDLTTGLVGEFPELQGYMGGIYAKMDGESVHVSTAISYQYNGFPKLSEVRKGSSVEGLKIARAISIAEDMDRLLGYFHVGRIPTASADPFALRRSGIQLVKILSYSGRPDWMKVSDDWTPIDITLKNIINSSAKQWNEQRITVSISEDTKQKVYDFIIERMLNYNFGFSYTPTAIQSALNATTDRPLYIIKNIAKILSDFSNTEHGQAVAAANKRIANILKKAGDIFPNIDTALFEETAEHVLFDALQKLQADFPSEPKEQLEALASLRQAVDSFFDDVMVMADDEKVKANRLALLAQLRALFLQLADISKL
ncbi:MAG: glycine--tRNA ligase subunit beta [Zetaproteobacteria bacterium]|nr:glycine--tRNA ligase subunit beta [Zetaproteobacteria bacterium]